MNRSHVFKIIPVLLLMSLGTYGQYEKNILRLNYLNSSGEVGFTTFIYNGKPNPYKAIWELKDGSRWSVNYHEFDSEGNIISKHREFSDSLITDQEFVYNSDGKITSETFSRSDGVNGKVGYFYKDGRMEYADCKGLNGWFFGKIKYKYSDNSSKAVSAILEKDGKRIGTIKYAYNNLDQLTIETWIFDSGFSQKFEYMYIDTENIHYKSSNVFIRDTYPWIVAKESYDYSGQGGGPSYYNNSKEGMLIEKTFVRSDGLKTSTDYHYLDNGLLERSVRHYSDGKTGTFSYNYNSNNNLTYREFTRSDGFTAYEKYNYDKHGRLISGEYNKFDTWLSGKLSFKHDRYDRIISAEYTGDNGLNAEILFEYNENSCLTRVHWEFSDNTTQTYWFEYTRLPTEHFPLSK